MKYQVENVTMKIDRTSGEFAGDCRFYVPFKNVRFFRDACGVEVNPSFYGTDSYEPIFFHSYGDIYMDHDLRQYWSTSADLLIAYLSWLLSEDGPQSVSVEYSNPFWAIHDFEHALNDESGCTIYVDAQIEHGRIEETFILFKKEGYELTWELLEEVTEAYNGRFKTNVSFDHHFEFEEEEEYA